MVKNFSNNIISFDLSAESDSRIDNFFVTKVDFGSSQNDPTLITLNDGSRWAIHPHYQYGPAPYEGMEVVVVPMKEEELSQHRWFYDYPTWLATSKDGETQNRFPMRKI